MPKKKIDINSDFFKEVCNVLNTEADRDEHAAGMQGESGDRGASEIRDQIRFYIMGQEGKFPDTWDNWMKSKKTVESKDYQEFLKLRNKFEKI